MVVIRKTKNKKFSIAIEAKFNTECLNSTEVLNSRQSCIKNILAVMKVFNSNSVRVKDESYKDRIVNYTLMSDGSRGPDSSVTRNLLPKKK